MKIIFPKIDLIQELKNINTKDASFFDFYRYIRNVLNEARDGHFSFNFEDNSKSMQLGFADYIFCIPFCIINEVFDEENKVNDSYLTFKKEKFCRGKYSNETLEEIEKFEGHKIIKINNINY